VRGKATFEDLVRIMDRLRDPGGCPWDREQTFATLRAYLLEECYEAVEALDAEDLDGLREELGDLLFQIVFLSRLGAERKAFAADDVVDGIATKIVRRHPHVFGSERADTSEEVLRNWEEIKKVEKAEAKKDADASVLAGIPKALPALLKAQRLGTKAARVGFDWPSSSAVAVKVEEEWAELRERIAARDAEGTREELGDVLFAVVMLARHVAVDPEAALEATNRKFEARFRHVEAELTRRGVATQDAGLELLDQLWDEAKRQP
jgi:MazG family protein